eukprot:TRINITY_DN897_c0_g1_i7.p1 TRINITY_DN897_c0_g1~~TRINITY_DN897_c0_g1_i7.p1  ORF type:complete len:406 (+),score=106.62 TRINITY_DN897_c0_g1_i7:161-1219(+)
MCIRDSSKHVVTASFDKTVKVWNTENQTNTLNLVVAEKPGVDDMQMGAAKLNNSIVSVSLSGEINVWNVDGLQTNSQPNTRLIGHKNPLRWLTFDHTSKTLVSADSFGRILFWRNGLAERPAALQYTLAVARVFFNCDGKTLYSISTNSILREYDYVNNALVKETNFNVTCNDFAVSKSNPKLTYLATDKNVIFVIENLEIKSQIKVDFQATALDVNINDTTLAVGDTAGQINIIDIASAASQKKFKHSDIKVTQIRYSHGSDTFLATADSTKKIKLWNGQDHSLIEDTWVYHNSTVTSLLFTPDNKFLLSAGNDNRVYVWGVESKNRELEIINTHKSGTACAVFDLSLIHI